MTGTRNQTTLLVPNVALDRDGRIIIPASRHARRSDPVDRLGPANSLFDPSGKLLVHAGKLAAALRPPQPRLDRRQQIRLDDGTDLADMDIITGFARARADAEPDRKRVG